MPKKNQNRKVNKMDIRDAELIDEEYVECEDYDILLCSHKNLRDSTTGKQYNSYSFAISLGRVGETEVCGEYNKFLYEKDIEERREELLAEGVKVPSKKVLEQDFKFLSKLGFVDIINTKSNGLCYIIRQSVDGKYFTPIPLYKWRELVVSTNRNMLKLFVCISMHKDISITNEVKMTREYLCKLMNIEPTEGNKKYIGRMTKSLKKLGMIQITQDQEIVFDKEKNKKVVKTHNYYRLTTREEYENKDKIEKRNK